ncbi:autotransporter outer membrane beta-barrel domain-containing protein [Cloacibacillus porcorum]|uniref:autotransporter outer membrane beta-barrel domain-containing protein n=1 Tax=Cloacibacillus porcorum TaxID=1197717 RepID=UPI001459C9F2|nr:autotransporter outer membrane beta-barrel domain-containing protein [Cloacibacillus porcorum]MDY5389799.1 autotransporter outer membrane beta-barrel domain-containing protein [Cloacibacillus porcorum]NMF17520.1 autotransporter outer membrane beta-barrel domain-containing protein [Cloacibacillus porcorum]
MKTKTTDRLRKGISPAALLCSLALIFTPAAASADPMVSVTDGSTQEYDTNYAIDVPQNMVGTPAVYVGGLNGGTVRFKNNLTINNDTPMGSLMQPQGIQVKLQSTSGNTIVEVLGKALINTREVAVNADAYNSDTYSAEVRLGDGSEINSANNVALSAHRSGLIAVGDGAKITGNAYGATVATIVASSGGKVEIGDNAEIGQIATNYSANRIALLSYNTTGSLNGYIRVGDNSRIYSLGTGEGSSAVVAGYVSSFMNTVTIYDGNIEIGKNADISAAGDGAFTVWSRHEDSSIKIGENSLITASGNDAAAVRSGIRIGYYDPGLMYKYVGGGLIEIGAGSTVKTTGDGSYGLDSRYNGSHISLHDNSTISTVGEKAYGVTASSGGDITLGSVSVSTSGKSAIGLLAGGYVDTSNGYPSAVDAGVINADNGLTVVTTGENAHGVTASFGGQVNLGGNINIDVDSGKGSYAIGAAGRAALGSGSAPTVSGSGVFDVKGDIGAVMGGQVNLGMEDGSVFTGATRIGTYYDITDPQAIFPTMDSSLLALWSNAPIYFPYMDQGTSLTLALNGANSVWNVTEDSNLTKLSLDGATVNLAYEAPGNSSTPFKKLTIGNLNESAGTGKGGVFVLRVNDAPGGLVEGDKLHVDGKVNGVHKLFVANNGAANALGNENVSLVETSDTASDGGSFRLANSAVSTGEAEVVELGAFQYKVSQKEGSDEFGSGRTWYLYGAGAVDPGDKPTPPPSSNPASAAINTFAANYLLNYAETDTLIRRLGDLRFTEDSSGAWFRAYGGKFESNSRSFVKEFDMNYGGAQLGYDRKLEKSWLPGGDTYLGLYFGYSKGDLDYRENGYGSGDAENKTLGAYATYVAKNGFYVDAIIKYVWSKNDFSVYDSQGTMVTGDDVSLGGFGASLEIGKRFRFKANVGGGAWYVEPQAQLSYQRQGSAYFTANNGLNIGIDDFNSLLGRIGTLIGYETEKTNFYAKVSYVKEFDGDMDIRYGNGTRIAGESFGDEWWVYGIGVTHQVNQRNSLYLSLERSSGGSFTEDWALRGGWRITF